MSELTTILRRVRRAAGLSQRQLALVAHVAQPTIAAYESGRREPGARALAALVGAAGSQLVSVPTTRPTVAATADAVRTAIADGDHARAWRIVLGLNDTLTREAPTHLVALSLNRPESTGDDRLDATIAGLVEHHLSIARCPVPGWVDEPGCVLSERWYVDDSAYGRAHDPAATPDALLRRGVVWAAEGLQSV